MSSLFRTFIFRATAASSRSRLLPRVAGTRAMSDHSTRHGNDPEIIEKNKQSLLRKHAKDSKEEPHWHEELASDAEAFIKAQRDEINASSDEIAKLQESTKKQLDPKLTNKRD